MHAIRQHAFGPAENLRYEEVADPHPGPGQVRIAVAAAGVHLVDTMIRQGVQGGPFPRPELPMTPGREVAGVVDEIGADVDPVWLGRRVVTHLGMAGGGYAELAVREVESLHVLPEDVGFEAAVAMIGTGRTTMAILRIAGMTPDDDVVVVTSAAGGIGNLLVQRGRTVGATVVGAAGSAAKVEKVRALGAAVAVDYTTPDWTTAVRDQLGGREATLVLDGAGGRYGREAFDLLGSGGRIVMYGRPFGPEHRFTSEDLFDRALSATVGLGPNLLKTPGGLRALEEESMTALAGGGLTPLVHAPFPLAEAAAAHTALENRRSYGKVVLEP
ncbi:NADPH2:quinone reductase [Saccharopolyspora erythraea NRRL 2338]|uniref:Oxidoreductase n=2 Tax=Saccharopolyspora erythraea TaxID=1836 RepID=A4FK75_SACEN|nr:zinc-binding dehydrogenase [Saccharopolyspora erythraea]EQD85266.1 NADPH:quinone reductase [Saccharopolyspora erythraea D]PFG98088.1 NADPH2:quinone reductase [Saccharopolyspora erythraea NRRL 2338]QRK88198.1 zinc-binding dehydrogenase [Saccharopolyspora erythraea]CAM04450.1 putative oxidoreductase [Saccharopolyspora erythraea NRRL 2338]